MYAQASYTDVELSAAMGQRATETVEQAGHDNFAVVNGDITDTRASWTAAAGVGGEELCYIILMEVLDNLPHDKIELRHQSPSSQARRTGGSGSDDESDTVAMHQIVVVTDEATQMPVERSEPLTDPLLCRALEIDNMHQLRESEAEEVAASSQTERFPDYTAGRGEGEGVLGSLLVRSFVRSCCNTSVPNFQTGGRCLLLFLLTHPRMIDCDLAAWSTRWSAGTDGGVAGPHTWRPAVSAFCRHGLRATA